MSRLSTCVTCHLRCQSFMQPTRRQVTTTMSISKARQMRQRYITLRIDRQISFSLQSTRFSISSVMDFLRWELRRYKNERAQWDLERAVLHKRVNILQGECSAIVKILLCCMRIAVSLRTLQSAISSITSNRLRRSYANAGVSHTRSKRISTRRNTSQVKYQVCVLSLLSSLLIVFHRRSAKRWHCRRRCADARVEWQSCVAQGT